MPALIATSGPLAGERFEIVDEIVLGRENAGINLADDETSRRHAILRPHERVALIEDAGSTNGTFVNGARISERTELKGGDTIRVGQTTFELEADPEPVDEGATRVATRPEVEDVGATRLHQAPPEPDATRLHDVPEPKPVAATAARTAPVPAAPAPPPAPPPSAPAPRAPARPAAAPSAPLLGAFEPPAAATRKKGIATRKVGPTLYSFAVIIGTAVALVVYFIGRGA